MVMQPKISIVTISYNQKKYLDQCINSVINQDYSNLEYIIVDPGSMDGSRELINSYGKIIKKIFEPDNGPADGLNKGFELATGEIYFFLNSDDMLLPNSLKMVEHYFSLFKDIDVLIGAGIQLNANRNEKSIKSDTWHLNEFLFGANVVFQQSTFFRSSIFRKTKGFNIDNRSCWDSELWIDLACVDARFLTVNDKFGFFRIHDDSISGTNRLKKIYQQDQIRMASKILKRDISKTEWYIKNIFYRFLRKFNNFHFNI